MWPGCVKGTESNFPRERSSKGHGFLDLEVFAEALFVEGGLDTLESVIDATQHTKGGEAGHQTKTPLWVELVECAEPEVKAAREAINGAE